MLVDVIEAGIRAQAPSLSEEDVRRERIRRILGDELFERAGVRQGTVTKDEAVARFILDTLARLGIPAIVVGSFASNVWGDARATHDLDLVVELDEGSITALVDALAGEFYVDEVSVRRAVRSRDLFSVIHLETSLKIDFFIRPDTDFERERFARAKELEVWGTRARFATPEDSILSKLRSFADGGRSAGRQWQDVLDVAETQATSLDWTHLERWSARLGVRDLLDELRASVADGEEAGDAERPG